MTRTVSREEQVAHEALESVFAQAANVTNGNNLTGVSVRIRRNRETGEPMAYAFGSVRIAVHGQSRPMELHA